GETLEADLQLSDVERFLGGSYTIPSFMRPDQRLILKSGYREEYQDAYDATSISATGTVDRDLTRELSVGAGAGYRLAQVEQMGEKTDLGLLFFPGNLLYDARDNELDPSQGLRFNLRLTPFLDTMDLETRFLKTYASLSNYLELWPQRIVLANRVAYGAIGAEDKRKVPPDERFYAGGGGSIRGYAYQKVGPMEDGDPIGGLALAEVNTELRFKLSRNSGLVMFLDGGQAYEDSYPDFSENLRWGTGIGYRYYTDFGPLRADIAFPLNRRSKDSAYQLYLSIGQAF
ncbi:BamA/TamA family outer membrane protein, partial [Desulfonatronospira sp. MSAO_Bac3]